MLSTLRARRRPLRRVVAVMAVAALAFAGTSAAQADELARGDSLTLLNGQTFSLGQVACNSDVSKQVVVAIEKSQGGANSFGGDSNVTVSGATNAPLSVGPEKTVALPSGWDKAPDGTKSPTVTIPVTVRPTSSGLGSGTVTFTAKGTTGNNKSLQRDATVTFSWTAVGCSTDTSIALTCPDSVTYTRSAIEPCVATVRLDGRDQAVPVTYSANTNVGTATASASYAGDATHNPSNKKTTFQITKAPSTVMVSCHDVTYDATAQTPCSAEATGAGDLKVPLTVTYVKNTNAGTATANATWTGDANHVGNSGSANFTIAKASSMVRVNCDPKSVTYDGTAHTDACTATVTGAGDLNDDLPVKYDPDNVTDVGTVTASASYGGGANHTPSKGSSTFAISQATSVTTFDCADGPFTYTGETQTPCTATAKTSDGLEIPAQVEYTANVNAGTVHVTATYAGDGNHEGSQARASFVIGKAPVEVRVTCTDGPFTYDGEPQAPCSATATGPKLDEKLPVSYTDNVNAGTAKASASWAESDNYLAGSDSTTFTIDKATSRIKLTCDPATYNGEPLEPCTATVTGAGTIDTSVNEVVVSYSGNVDAGTAQVIATWEGDDNHSRTSASKTFTIDRATSALEITCDAATYNGKEVTPCRAELVDVVGQVDASVPIELTYTNNIDAGTGSAEVTATWDGDANHDGTSKSANFTIAKAPSTVTVTCDDVTYTGDAQTPCKAAVGGDGVIDSSVPFDWTYESNVNAGRATGRAGWPGDANHEGNADSQTFEIGKASSTVSVECSLDSVKYDGTAHDVCTATVTGAGGLNDSLKVSYDDSTNAGTVTARAWFHGDANHTRSKGSSTFAISPAASSVNIVCQEGPFTYDGLPHDVCRATVSGAGELSVPRPIEVSYSGGDNVNAGTVTVTAVYAGDRNHIGSDAKAEFEIGRAKIDVTVICTEGPHTYDGTSHEPCEATATGPGGLTETLKISYIGNVDAGTATASATRPESGNYLMGTNSATFTIDKAESAVTVTCPTQPVKFTGSAQELCTATPTGIGGVVMDATNPVVLSYLNNIKAGTATVTATWPGDKNHNSGTGTGSFTIAAWDLDGYERPVEMSTASTMTWNSVKGGSTVPLKFGASAYGRAVTSVAELGATFSVKGMACPGSKTVAADMDLTTTGGTELRAAGGRFIQNWQTPKVAGACYMVTTTTADGSSISALFMLK